MKKELCELCEEILTRKEVRKGVNKGKRQGIFVCNKCWDYLEERYPLREVDTNELELDLCLTR